MTRRKLAIIANIISVIPGILLVPLAPFAFILVYGEGQIPGSLHENLMKGFMIAYPFVIFFSVFAVVKLLKNDKAETALAISLFPLLNAAAIILLFFFGGIQIR